MKVSDLFEMPAESFSTVRSIFRSNFARRKIELSLPTHAAERSVVGNRGDDVSDDYLIKALEQFLKKYDAKSPDIVSLFKQVDDKQSLEVTFQFSIDDTQVNFPTAIKRIGGTKGYKFTVKTIMVKKDFKAFRGDIVVSL